MMAILTQCCSTHPRDVIIPSAFSEDTEIALISSSISSSSSSSSSTMQSSSPKKHINKKMVRFHNIVKVNEYKRWCSPQLGTSISEMVKRNYEERRRIHRFIQSWQLERQCGHLHDDLCTLLDQLETWEDPDDMIVFKREYEVQYGASATPRTPKKSGSPTAADDNLSMSRSTFSDTTISYLAIPMIEDKKQPCMDMTTKDGRSVVDMIEIAYRRLDSRESGTTQ